MRVLFHTAANRSHLHIAAPFAWAMRNAGHEVVVAAQPDLVDAVAATGLTGVAIGDPDTVELTARMNAAEPPPPQRGADEADGANPVQAAYAAEDPRAELESLVTHLFPVMCPEPVFDDLVDFARSWRPDLVVWDMLHYAGPVAALATGAAHARLVLATDGFGQLRTAFRQLPDAGDDPMRAWLEPLLERYGARFDEDAVLGQWSLDLMPSWTYHPDGVQLLPVRHVPFNGPAMAPRWLFEPPARPRVCLTLGNSHREAGRVEASSAALVEAVAELDVEVVATLDAEQLGGSSLPDNVRTVDFVPLNLLLPTCSAIIHHGGAGTFAAAVEHGVPQLISPSPWWSEKWYGPVAMANGVQDNGAGTYVADADRLTAAGLKASLERVLGDPSYRENAERLRKDTLRMPTPAEIVPALEDLTARHRGAAARPGDPT